MRIMRFLLLCTTAWAAQWQQTPYIVPPVYEESTRMEQSANHYSPPPPQASVPHEREIDFDIIQLDHVSLSLRLTCEVNRRLLDSIRNNPVAATNSPSNANPLLQRGGDNHLMNSQHYPINIHPSQSWQPPIHSTPADQGDDELTVFHAKAPRPNRRGVARWGPDLTSFLEYVMGPHVLNVPVNQRSMVMALALVYLDRACSVETVRGNGVLAKKCPYCTPQTVHRLVLVALMTATRAIVGDTNNGASSQQTAVTQKLGIPAIQLSEMQQLFLASLGTVGLYVDPTQLLRFLQTWHDKFNKRNVVPVRQSMAPMQQQQQQPQQQWA